MNVTCKQEKNNIQQEETTRCQKHINQNLSNEEIQPESLIIEFDPYMTSRQSDLLQLRTEIEDKKNLDEEVDKIAKKFKEEIEALKKLKKEELKKKIPIIVKIAWSILFFLCLVGLVMGITFWIRSKNEKNKMLQMKER